MVNERRIGGNSAITFCPLIATAAAELAAGMVYVSSIGQQTATISHSNSTQPDRVYRLVITG